MFIKFARFKNFVKHALLEVNFERGLVAIVGANGNGKSTITDGLYAALTNGTIAGAGLDVYENAGAINPRLRELKNVVLLPHMGSATVEGRLEMGEKVLLNIKTFDDGHRPPDQIVPSML